MVYHEGILVSSNEVINSAAIGAEITRSRIRCNIYKPSDTARNLEIGSEFTYSLTDDICLFFRSALTGRNKPDQAELTEEELHSQKGFFYPKRAASVYFCRVEDLTVKEIRDEYGEAEIKKIEGNILWKEEMREAEPLDRDDALIDAMVHASRLSIADEKQREGLREKIKTILRSTGDECDDERDMINKINEYIEKW